MEGKQSPQISLQWPGLVDTLYIDQLMFYSDLLVGQLRNKKESLP